MIYRTIVLKEGNIYSFPYKPESATEEIDYKDEIIHTLYDELEELREFTRRLQADLRETLAV